MKKNKTTKTSKKSYSSVKEILKDNNSKIKLTPFNCKEAKFGKTLTISNPSCLDGKFDVIFRRASTSEKFFGDMEKQRPNQIVWNEEEQQAYFLNPDKQLYKILFEPIYMKKKERPTEEYMENLKKGYIRREIKDLAIPWSKFHNPNSNLFDKTYDTRLLTPMFIDLLILVKQKKIKISCGVAMMQLLSYYANYSPSSQKILVGGCEIILEVDFNLGKYDMVYDDVFLVGQNVHDICDPKYVPDEVLVKETKKKSLLERIFGENLWLI